MLVNPVTRLPLLEETILATTRYLEALTFLSDEDCQQPSALPGWTRGHVITHLARNADGLGNLLRWAQTGQEMLMYPSRAVRDAQIEEGAARTADELRADASASAGRFVQAANEVHSDRLGHLVKRMGDGELFPAHRVGSLRRTEVEVHHADLLLDYGPRDWPVDFTRDLLERRTEDMQASGPGMTWLVEDAGERVVIAGGGPEVHGLAADFAWWAIGRGGGQGLSVTGGAPLPTIASWR